MPDLIRTDLRVLFCGINPSLYSAAVRHHFARPGNRFWKTLQLSGFTERLLEPHEERELVENGIGITNLVARATATAAELSPSELLRGATVLRRKVERFQPKVVAFVGIQAYRVAFGEPGATVGAQTKRFGRARVWVLPNPSGLNAHYQLDELAALFAELANELKFGARRRATGKRST